MPQTVWTALDLDRVSTDVLRGLDLRRAPSPIVARVIRETLATRAREGR